MTLRLACVAALLGSFAAAWPALAARSQPGTASYSGLTTTGDYAADLPVAIVQFFAVSDLTHEYDLVDVCDPTNNTNEFSLTFRGDVDASVYWILQPGAAGTHTSTSVTVAGSWHCAGCQSTSSSAHAVYLDGGGKGTNATTTTAASLTSLNLGRFGGLTPANFLSGSLGPHEEFDGADGTLSDADFASLAAGQNPKRSAHRASLFIYLPMLGESTDEVDVIAGRRFTTSNSTAQALCPPLIRGGSR